MDFFKPIDRVALKIRVISRKTNPSCSVLDSQLRVWLSEVCGGELGCGGKPCGVTDGKERGCSWQVLRLCGCPCGGREEGKRLARALGKGTQEVALGQLLPDSDHLSFFLCLPFFQVHQRLSPWQSVRVVYCSTVVPSDGEYTRAPASLGLA